MSAPTDPQPCLICRRRDCGLGVHKGKNGPLRWFCQDCGPNLACKAIAMASREFDRAEQHAVQEAGDAAGAYLDSIGKTDLATLTEAEWGEFCRRMVRGFETAMREAIRRHEAPF